MRDEAFKDGFIVVETKINDFRAGAKGTSSDRKRMVSLVIFRIVSNSSALN